MAYKTVYGLGVISNRHIYRLGDTQIHGVDDIKIGSCDTTSGVSDIKIGLGDTKYELDDTK